MRIKLLLSYNGASFEGSQVQKHTDNTIMGKLYEALQTLNITTKLHASGRTDAGVHAFKQVMHCDIPDYWTDLTKLKEHLQYQLPESIYLRSLSEVDPSFHARYSAKRRAYRYILSDGKVNPFESGFTTFVKTPLDHDAIRDAMKVFEGEHDFSLFKKSGSSATTSIRYIYKSRVYTYKNRTILYFEANGFLRSQIRLMVAFILQISEHKRTKEELVEQLLGIKKHNTRPAPSNGLYLSNIIY